MSLYQPFLEEISQDSLVWSHATSVQLPTDHPRSKHRRKAKRNHELPLSAQTVRKMQEIGRREQATFDMTVLSVFHLLLMRYSGQDEYVIETKLAGSTSVLTLVHCQENPSFREWLSQVKKMVRASVEISEEAQKWESLRAVQFASYLDNHEEITEFFKGELKLSIYPKEMDWYACFSYDPSLFNDETIRRMGEHLLCLLEEVVKEPDRSIRAYSILTQREADLFEVWNRTHFSVPERRSVDQWIARRAKQTPEALAVKDSSQSLTYGELEHRANQMAHYLQKRGVQSGDLVAICLERSCDAIISLLAVLKLGAAYVPIDPAYPTERITYMLHDSEASLVLTDTQWSQKCVFPAERVVYIDLERSAIASMSADSVSQITSHDQLSYVIYTSGSTGQPKGVMISHRSLLNLIFWHLNEYQLTSADRTSYLAGPAFDASVWEIWPTLVAGATLCIPDEEKRISPEELQSWLIAEKITVSFLPTPLLERVLTLKWPKQTDLRTLLTGGDQLRQTPPADFPIEVVNHYGPTENTVVTTAFRVSSRQDKSSFPPIGRPIANTEVYVLDRFLQPVPLGVPGELYVGGRGLSQGYFRRPELTAERFIPHPFSTEPGAKLYRTGDQVRWLPDGNLAFLGRLDDQVKIRGFRVELGEIEQVLCQHQEVRQAVVLVREDQRGEKQLVAYLQLKRNADIDWRSYLSRKLPDYMVPAAFVVLDSFPLTPNGKVDRRALPAPKLTSDRYVAPETETEKKIAAIWEEVFQKKPIGRKDHFLARGGHSLLAAQIMARVNQRFAVKLPFSLPMEAGTVQRLAKEVDRQKERIDSSSSLLAAQDSKKSMLPMSFAQQRLWFLQRLRPDQTAYHIPFVLRIRGRLDTLSLKRSIDRLVHRHPQLRTVFSEVDGETVQIVKETMDVGWSVQDFRKSSSPEKEAERWIEEEAATPFQLQDGPLLRCHLLQIGGNDWLFLIHMHHIISDGWSMGVFLEELWQYYVADQKGEECLLAEQPVQYTDFTLWQQKWCKQTEIQHQLTYWKQKLADVPVLQLPTDQPRPPVQTFVGDTYECIIPKDLLQRLKQLSQQENSTLFMTMLAAFQVLLYRYTGQRDFAVGSPIAGRNHPELEKIIGFFVNTLVFRTPIAGTTSFRNQLQQVRQTTLEAYAYQDVPFDQLVTTLQPERKLSHSPLFQVMFGFQELPEMTEKINGLEVETIGLKHKTAKFDLTLMLYQKGERLIAAFEYNSDLFRSMTIKRMADNFLTLLTGIVEQPEQQVGKLPLLSRVERQQLTSWNDTATVPMQTTCIHRLFEQQVEATPEKLAVRYQNQTLRYRELNERANQLAHYLQRWGVTRGTFVGVCLDRSPELLIAILAILKTGAAYVPLDPQYPTARIAYMLEDAKPKVVLTEQKWRKVLPKTTEKVICIDQEQSIISKEQKENPEGFVHPSDLAYLIYTSGSTGKPKGVMIEHQSATILITWAQRTFLPEEREGVLATTSICFDLSVFEMFVPLSCGGCVILAENALELPFLPARDQVTLVNTVPSAAKELINVKGIPASVKVINLAGEPLPLTLVQQLYKESSVEKVYNLYGPSEDTTYSTYALIGREEQQQPVIGRPLDHTRLYVLDENLELVPIGVPGELYIGGAGLARGYLNKPKLTQERFISSHSLPREEVIYKTGDLVRYREDGMLEFLGRLDHQVKIRGFRVELGEIEHHLRQHPAVSEVVVVAHEEQQRTKSLVAYLVLNQQQELSREEWQQYLKERLPDYMIPTTFMILDQLPLTPNGKVDRKRLPSPSWNRERGKKYVPPRTEAEEKLAKIWSQVLNVSQIGRHDHFFELGGDSILTLQVIAKANKEGIHLTPKHFFDYPTIAELAKVIAEKKKTIQAEQGKVSGEVPLTPIQHWFFEQQISNPHNWNQSVLLRLQPDTELTLLEKAFHLLVEHHDGLRLRFAKQGDTWKQWYDSTPSHQKLMSVQTVDVPISEEQTVLERHWEQLEERLHLEKGPLLQAEVLRFPDGRPNYLIIAIHHLVVDGVSWRILLDDLQTIYDQLLKEQPVVLPSKTTSYQEWAHRLQREAHSPKRLKEKEYWLRQLQSISYFPLPVDWSAERGQPQAVSQVITTLDQRQTKRLQKETPVQFRANLPELLLTVLLRTFTEWTKRRTLLVNVEGYGRDPFLEDVDLTRTIGWFTTIHPLLLKRGSARSWMEEVSRVKEQYRRVPEKGFGYGLLRYLADQPTRQIMEQQLKAEICFNYLGQLDQLIDASSCFDQLLQFRGPSEKQTLHRPHLIDLAMMIHQDQLQMIWIYDQARYKPTTIQRLADRYLELLCQLISVDQRSSGKARQFAPSDFSRANLSRGDLEKVLSKLKGRNKK